MILAVVGCIIGFCAVTGYVAYKKGYDDGYKKGSYGSIDLC